MITLVYSKRVGVRNNLLHSVPKVLQRWRKRMGKMMTWTDNLLHTMYFLTQILVPKA